MLRVKEPAPFSVPTYPRTSMQYPALRFASSGAIHLVDPGYEQIKHYRSHEVQKLIVGFASRPTQSTPCSYSRRTKLCPHCCRPNSRTIFARHIEVENSPDRC